MSKLSQAADRVESFMKNAAQAWDQTKEINGMLDNINMAMRIIGSCENIPGETSKKLIDLLNNAYNVACLIGE